MGVILATDEDSVGEIFYSIQQIKPTTFDTLSLFSINSLNGVITVASNDSSAFKSDFYEVKIYSKKFFLI